MGSMSIWHWLVLAFVFFFTIIPVWRILTKAGFSGWWSLLSFIPLLNVLFIWVFAFVRWPTEQAARLDRP